MDLTPADLVKLKNAGVSENVIGVMLDPASNPGSGGGRCSGARACSRAGSRTCGRPLPPLPPHRLRPRKPRRNA